MIDDPDWWDHSFPYVVEVDGHDIYALNTLTGEFRIFEDQKYPSMTASAIARASAEGTIEGFK